MIKFKDFPRPLHVFQVLFKGKFNFQGLEWFSSTFQGKFNFQGLFKAFECFSSTFQGKFNFQRLFKTVLHIQVLFKPVWTLCMYPILKTRAGIWENCWSVFTPLPTCFTCKYMLITCLFVWFDSLHPINNLSVKQGQIFLGWISTKLG